MATPPRPPAWIESAVPGILRCAAIAHHADPRWKLAVWTPGCRDHNECQIYEGYCAWLKESHAALRAAGRPQEP